MENIMVEGQSDDDVEFVDSPARGLRQRRAPALGVEGKAAQLRAAEQLQKGERDDKPPAFRTRRSGSPEPPRGAPAVSIEDQARKARIGRRGSDAHRDSVPVRIKKDKPPKTKGNESPFFRGAARPPRAHAQATSYSSPLKRSDEHEQRRPPAASEPRRRTLGGQLHRDGQPSSPTFPAPSHQGERPDENSHKSPVQPPFTSRHNAAASSSRIPAAGPSRGEPVPELIHVGDSDDDLVDNDENRPPPPRPAFDNNKRFNSAVPPLATAPVTRARGNGVASSSRGAARGQQGNRHTPGHGPLPSRRSNDASSEEEEDIELFSSLDSWTGPPQSKGKEKAPAPPERPPAPRVRRKMQDKNGNVTAQDARRPPQLKPAAATQQLPSSTSRVLVKVREYHIETLGRRRPLSQLAFERSRHELMFIHSPDTMRRINLDAVAAIYDGNFVLDFHLSPSEVNQLWPFLDDDFTSAASTADYTDLRTLFIAEDQSDSREFILKATSVPNLKNKIENVERSGIDCLRCGPGTDERKTKAKPARSAPMAKAGEAAERRRATSAVRPRTKEAGAATKKSAQVDSRQSTLTLPSYRKSSRLAHVERPTQQYRESSPQPENDRVVVSVRPPVDKKQFLFHLHGLDITAGEKYRLESNDFLNDTFLEFGLRYVLDQLPQETRDEVHCFNSFFYAKLSEKPSRKSAPSNSLWPAYDAVKRWTRKVDIFKKKFIIVPVNESYHWYLAVIYNPQATLDLAHAAHGSLTDALRDDLESRESSMPPGVLSEDSLEGNTRDVSRSSAAGTPVGRHSALAYDNISSDTDELNIIDQPDDELDRKEEGDVVAVRAGVNKLQLEAPPPAPAAPPQPISSATFDLFTAQSLSDMCTDATAEESTSRLPSSGPAPVKKGRKPNRDDYDISGGRETWIITLDSMGGKHPSVANNLRKWLHFEALDKLGLDVDFDPARYLEGKCLEQPNFYDCGLYLIHFTKQLLLNSNEVLRFIGDAPRTNGVEGHEEWKQKKDEVWAAHEPSTLRREWVQIIDEETAKYNSLHDTGTTGQTAPDTAPNESQVSVQALSQAAPAAYPATTSVAQDRSPDPGNATDPTRRSASASTSAQLRLRYPVSPSPEGEGSAPTPAPRDHSAGPSSRANSHEPRATWARGKPKQRPRVSHALSESEEEEEVEEREVREVREEDDLAEPEELGPNAQTGMDASKSPDEPHEVAEAEVDELDDDDDGEIDDDLLCRRANIDPNLPPTRPDAFPSDVLNTGSPSWSSQARVVPGSYPPEAMDVDEASEPENAGLTTTPAPRAVSFSPTDSVDPFANLGSAKPIHRESEGGGRTDPRRSSTAYTERPPASHAPSSEPKVLVAASSSRSTSLSAHSSDRLDALANAATSLQSGMAVYQPYQMLMKPQAPEQPAPSSDPIFVDDDSSEDSRAGSPTRSRRGSPHRERPESKRTQRSREPSNDSPPPGPRTTRRVSRRHLPASSDNDAPSLPAGAALPSTRGVGKRRASKAPAETIAVSSDERAGSDVEGSEFEPGPSRQTAKPRGKPTPAVKTNGKGRMTRSEAGRNQEQAVVIDGEDDEKKGAAGPSVQRREREPSLEPSKPKRPPAKMSAGTGKNKRRKTQDAPDQPKIRGFLSRSNRADLRTTNFHDRGADSDRRGNSNEPYLLSDDE